jgi:hypothetical protein
MSLLRRHVVDTNAGMARFGWAWLLAATVACSSGSSGSAADCDGIADRIRDRALRIGYDGDRDGAPDAKGVCNDTDATIRRDFGADCDALRACN